MPLADIIADVEAALAFAERECGTYAEDPMHWHGRHRIAMQALSRRLERNYGARIGETFAGARVRIAGITATSTSGIAAAIRGWLAVARKKAAR